MRKNPDEIVYVDIGNNAMIPEDEFTALRDRKLKRKEWLIDKLTTWFWAIWAWLFIGIMYGLDQIK